MSTTVSIILCSYNRAEHLDNTLQSLRQVKVPDDWTAELILVDNASTDATPEVMRAFTHPQMTVRVVREEKQGLSNARNRGVAESRGKVLLFTDDDVRFPDRWIERMCVPILRGKADAVAGGVELADSLQANWMTSHHRALFASTERISRSKPDQIVGANMAIGHHVFEHIPQFDPELGAGQLGFGEETLFSWQMREVDYHIVSEFDTVVTHHPDSSRLSRESFCDMAKKSGRSEAYINYHWRHQTHWSLIGLLGGLTYFGIKLLSWRLRHWNSLQQGNLRSMEEFDLVRRFYRIRQHLVERRREPNYDRAGVSRRPNQAAKTKRSIRQGSPAA